MKNLKRILLLLAILSTIPSLGQESIIKDFAEDGRKRWLYPICLYPSTLRMVNISGNEEFNQLVNDIEKVLIYNLDSTSLTSPKLTTWMKDYEDIGYEEYILLSGKQSLRLLGKGDEYVGMMGDNGRKIAFYLRGSIGFEKIPKLLQTFKGGDMLGILTDQFK